MSASAPPAAPGAPRLSTAVRLLLWMTAALLPLGLIAVFASIESAQSARLRREVDARAVAAAAARQLDVTIERRSIELRAIAADLERSLEPAVCRDRLAALRAHQTYAMAFALFDSRGRPICRTDGFAHVPAPAPVLIFATEVRLTPAANALRFESRNGVDAPYTVGEIPVAALADVARPMALSGGYRLVLRQGAAELALADPAGGRGLSRPVMVAAPVADGQLQLELTLTDPSISALEVVMTLLPLLMWLAAGLIGWLVVNRLIIRPLSALQGAVAGHRAGRPFVVPDLVTPSVEIRDLADAFRTATEELAAREGELEQGLARQTKLTREVHHRVKNNLQVVSSLIALHARGVDDRAVSAAYASIQRRVDALAVVHRNHYAELEENRGVGLRPLIGELAANLRATAPPEAGHLAITLDLAPLYTTQDTAVPVAFLITEIVELAMNCAPHDRITVALLPAAQADRAVLTVAAVGLTDQACRAHASTGRFDRVVEGLSRQLRAKLDRDVERGRFAIEIATRP